MHVSYRDIAVYHKVIDIEVGGRITKINSDNTVDVAYDKGLQEHRIPYHINRIRLEVSRDNNTHNNRRRSGRITRRNQFLSDNMYSRPTSTNDHYIT